MSTIISSIADSHDVTLHVPDGLMFDVDRSGNISEAEMTAFLAEIDAINASSRRYADMYFFNQSRNIRLKKSNVRVPRKQAIARFGGINKVVSIVFSDGA